MELRDTDVQVDFVDEHPETGRINLGLSTIVRVTLRDGTYHEDIGYGHCENTKGKAAAFEKAKKEAATDAMKRALRNFGNVLGNCLYDKDYLQKVTKVKVVPSKWDADNLHRHPDYAPIKKEASVGEALQPAQASAIRRNVSVQSAQSNTSFGSAEFEDDFGGSLFDDTDFTNPDEVRLDDGVGNNVGSPAQRLVSGHQMNGQRQSLPRTTSMPQMRPPSVQPSAIAQPPSRLQPLQRPPANAGQPASRMLPPQTPGNQHRVPPVGNGHLLENSENSTSNSSSASEASNNQDPLGAGMKGDQADDRGPPLPRDVPQGVPEGFVTGRIADLLNKPSDVRPPAAALAFNPHAESPSIRRTQGVNPGKSAPVSRLQIGGANSNGPTQHAVSSVNLAHGSNNVLRPQGADFVNPAADLNRKIGMPPSMTGRGSNGSAYRPPTAAKRPAMADVTNTYTTDGASDPKKARVDTAPPRQGENGVIDSNTAAT